MGEVSRYHRQELLPGFGAEGQARLAAARVLVVGCGALGSVVAEQIVRAGVGWVRIVDRDWVEMTNLQRQVLFDENDARERTPKAIAAAARLAQINSQVIVDPHVADVHSGNIEALMAFDGDAMVDAIIDGTDNVETRYLINDAAVKHGVPWVYGACVGTEGRVMGVWPGRSACLRCVFAEPPGPGELTTCDTAGVIGPAAAVVGALQSSLVIRSIVEKSVEQELVKFDLWSGRFWTVNLREARRADCVCCGRGRFELLERVPNKNLITLCGRNAVQIRPEASSAVLDLVDLERRLKGVGVVERTRYLIRSQPREELGVSLTIFPDGRAIIGGTTDLSRAKSLYARFVGN